MKPLSWVRLQVPCVVAYVFLLIRSSSCIRPNLGEAAVRSEDKATAPRVTPNVSERQLEDIVLALLKISHASKQEGGQEFDRVLEKNVHTFLHHLKEYALGTTSALITSEDKLVIPEGVLRNNMNLSLESMVERSINIEPFESK